MKIIVHVAKITLVSLLEMQELDDMNMEIQIKCLYQANTYNFTRLRIPHKTHKWKIFEEYYQINETIT